MRRKSLLLLAALLLTGSHLLSSHGADESSGPGSRLIYYEGLVAFVDHQTGELVIMGRKDDSPDDIIVKLSVDPREVVVSNAHHQDLTFVDVSKGDQIDADCHVMDSAVTVKEIFIYGFKPGRE